MNNRLFNRIVAFAALAWSASMNAGAGTVEIAPAAKNVAINESFELAVLGKGFAESVIGGGFNLSFDPSLLRLDGVSIAGIWEFLPSGGLTDNASGTLADASFNSFVQARSGDFDIAKLNFTALGAGSAVIVLAASPTFVFADSNANQLFPSFANGLVTVGSPVPIPPAFILLLSGMLPLLFRRGSQLVSS